jgi:hypothetical protein
MNTAIFMQENTMVVQELATVGQIADQLSEPPSRVAYMIAKLRLKARQRVGIIRLFDEGQIEAIKSGLHKIQIRNS